MNTLSNTWIAVSAAVLLASAAPARAEPVSEVSVAYNIDVGPMTMTVVKYGLKLREGAMRSRAQIKSQGLSRVFSEYTAQVEAESRASGPAIAPVSFRLVRERDDNTREARLQWMDGGGIDYAPREKKADRRARVDNALNAEVADPMTAVLRIGTSGKPHAPPCSRSSTGGTCSSSHSPTRAGAN
jgi:hypothetical protein